MLVLSRKSNQTLHIGDNIVVTVLRVRGDNVRIGIQAPAEVKIMRNELVAKIASAAALSDPTSDAKSDLLIEKKVVDTHSGAADAIPTATEIAEITGEHRNLEDSPLSGGPLTKFCRPQLRAIFADAS